MLPLLLVSTGVFALLDGAILNGTLYASQGIVKASGF
jgi:hypothetical protein